MTHTPEPIKFELTDTTITHWGVTLYQIRATEDIPHRGIRKGNLGGYVSSTHLPSGAARVFGNAWVSGDAQVFGNAWVSDAAQVSGSAQVFGDAQVSGDARVFDYARVSGSAQVSGDARVSGDAEILQTWHYLVVGPIGSEGTHATLARTKGGGHRLSVGCWEDGSLGTLMTEVKRRRLIWSSDVATQKLWMKQYRALLKLGKAVVARWIEAESRPAS